MLGGFLMLLIALTQCYIGYLKSNCETGKGGKTQHPHFTDEETEAQRVSLGASSESSPFVSMYLLGKSFHVVACGSTIITLPRKGKDPEVFCAGNLCKVGLGCLTHWLLSE